MFKNNFTGKEEPNEYYKDFKRITNEDIIIKPLWRNQELLSKEI